MNLDTFKTWAAAHKKELALGGAGAGVAGFALYRRHTAAAAAAAPGGVTVTPQAAPADPNATTDTYSGFTDAINAMAQQQQAGQQSLIDQVGQAFSAQSDSLGSGLAAIAAQQQTSSASLADLITGAVSSMTGAKEPAAPAAPRVGTRGVYTFKAGDTIDSAAARLGVTVGQLLAANPLSGKNFTTAGHTVTVPGATASAAGPKPAIVYTPGKGESVASIAKKFGISVSQLNAANSKSGQPLNTAGHRITIPGH